MTPRDTTNADRAVRLTDVITAVATVEKTFRRSAQYRPASTPETVEDIAYRVTNESIANAFRQMRRVLSALPPAPSGH